MGSQAQGPTPPTTRWDPGQYHRFSAPRLRPALDLLNQLEGLDPHTIYDLGCGTGSVTRILAQRWPEAQIVGVDHSAEMLARARATPSPITWVEADLASWEPPEPGDLLFSNAALHWLPRHRSLFPRLLEQTRPGGVLAIQMPLSWQAPSHRLMRQVLHDGGTGGRSLGDPKLRDDLSRPPVAQVPEYYDLLAPLTQALDLWTTEYLHVLEGDDAVLEWVRGTGLRPVLHSLDAEEEALFLTAYRRRLNEAYPRRQDGTTLYPFRRLFIVARRAH